MFSPLQMCINIYVSSHPIVSQEDLRFDDSLKHYIDNAKLVDQKPTRKIKNLTEDEKTSIFESYPFNGANPIIKKVWCKRVSEHTIRICQINDDDSNKMIEKFVACKLYNFRRRYLNSTEQRKSWYIKKNARWHVAPGHSRNLFDFIMSSSKDKNNSRKRPLTSSLLCMDDVVHKK